MIVRALLNAPRGSQAMDKNGELEMYRGDENETTHVVTSENKSLLYLMPSFVGLFNDFTMASLLT